MAFRLTLEPNLGSGSASLSQEVSVCEVYGASIVEKEFRLLWCQHGGFSAALQQRGQLQAKRMKSGRYFYLLLAVLMKIVIICFYVC